MTSSSLTTSGLRDSHLAGAPSAVVSGSWAQARGRGVPALDSSAVVGAEGEGESPRERSSLCGGAPKGAGAGPRKRVGSLNPDSTKVLPPWPPHCNAANRANKVASAAQVALCNVDDSAHGPGSSNTGPRTPPGQQKRLQHGVDTLHVVFRCEFPHNLFVRLQRHAPEKGIKGCFEVDGESFEVKRAGEGYKLATVECAIIVSNDPNGFHVKFEAGALLLRRLGLEQVCAFAQRIAENLTCQILEENRVRRADLFMDVAGVSFQAEDLGAFVSRAHREHGYHSSDRLHHAKAKGGGPRLTGFTFSPGNPLMVRLYDKLAELESVGGLESVKTKTELATFRSQGLSPGQEVWRLEAQLRTEVLKRRGVQTMAALIQRTTELWDYCFSGPKPWLRLVVPGSATRVERQRVDERWIPFEENPFVELGGPSNACDGDLGGSSPEQVLGTVQSFLGSKSKLSDLESVGSLEEMLDHDTRALKQVLLETLRKTPADAIQTRNAVRARYRLIDPRGQ